MRRTLLVISLLLSGVILFFWIATDHHPWMFSFTRGDRTYAIRSDADRLSFEIVGGDARAKPVWGGWELIFPDGTTERLGIIPEQFHHRNAYGFIHWHYDPITFHASKRTCSFDRFTIPFWALLLICLTPSAVTIRQRLLERRRRLRETSGLCLNCGYDLRATPDRCPECGAVPTTR